MELSTFTDRQGSLISHRLCELQDPSRKDGKRRACKPQEEVSVPSKPAAGRRAQLRVSTRLAESWGPPTPPPQRSAESLREGRVCWVIAWRQSYPNWGPEQADIFSRGSRMWLPQHWPGHWPWRPPYALSILSLVHKLSQLLTCHATWIENSLKSDLLLLSFY